MAPSFAISLSSFPVLLLSFFLSLLALVGSTPSGVHNSLYAPQAVACPSTPLVRPATGLSSEEADFIAKRKPVADAGLRKWLAKTNLAFNTSELPAVALAISGGGYRSLLTGGGLIQAFDERDSSTGTSGLYQSLTYHTALSGGSWLLSSFAGNGYPTISSLKEKLWKPTFKSGLFFADFSLGNPTFLNILNDILAKKEAGFAPVLDDVWGRLLSDQLLYGEDGGAATTLSGISASPNFTSYDVPFPIITALGVDTSTGDCFPPPNATQYEFSPFEFGSWDSGVAAFVPTRYLGSSLSDCQATGGNCITGFDNLGFILGASSNLFNKAVCNLPTVASSQATKSLMNLFGSFLRAAASNLNLQTAYARVPNPFQGRAASPLVAESQTLTIVDGGEAATKSPAQNIPLWPLLHPQRGVDVVVVSDNSPDTPDYYPNGNGLRLTEVQARAQGFSARFPAIPDAATFVARRLDTLPAFFGCRSSRDVLTVVYLPNHNWTFPSGQPELKLQYSPAETDGMVANGGLVATANGDPAWPACLACGIMAKVEAGVPAECDDCLEKYCYN